VVNGSDLDAAALRGDKHRPCIGVQPPKYLHLSAVIPVIRGQMVWAWRTKRVGTPRSTFVVDAEIDDHPAAFRAIRVLRGQTDWDR
jgi:hypothetical protein